MKKTLAMVLALVMMFTLLTGCGGGGGDSGGDGTGAEYTWRMALNGSAPGELGYDMATFFKEKVEELTSGRGSSARCWWASASPSRWPLPWGCP